MCPWQGWQEVGGNQYRYPDSTGGPWVGRLGASECAGCCLGVRIRVLTDLAAVRKQKHAEPFRQSAATSKFHVSTHLRPTCTRLRSSCGASGCAPSRGRAPTCVPCWHVSWWARSRGRPCQVRQAGGGCPYRTGSGPVRATCMLERFPTVQLGSHLTQSCSLIRGKGKGASWGFWCTAPRRDHVIVHWSSPGAHGTAVLRYPAVHT